MPLHLLDLALIVAFVVAALLAVAFGIGVL